MSHSLCGRERGKKNTRNLGDQCTPVRWCLLEKKQDENCGIRYGINYLLWRGNGPIYNRWQQGVEVLRRSGVEAFEALRRLRRLKCCVKKREAARHPQQRKPRLPRDWAAT